MPASDILYSFCTQMYTHCCGIRFNNKNFVLTSLQTSGDRDYSVKAGMAKDGNSPSSISFQFYEKET